MARAYPGNRPSATILCDDLNAATLGALIAFHEHRVFVSAMLLGINPFDQFGVELGKAIAKKIDAGGGEGFDPSTERCSPKRGSACSKSLST
jgi:glucose-6-phosphate isomerase